MVTFYHDILNHLPDAICVIDTNTNTVKYINATFSNQLLPHDLIIGQNFETQMLQEDCRENFLNFIGKIKTTSVDIDVDIGLCKSLSSLGKEKFPIYKNFFWVARKINNDCIMLRGNVDVAKCILPADTDNNYTEELLDFFQNAPIALHWLSGTGHILWANNAELESLGYTKEEYIGHHIMEFCPDEEVALNKVFSELSAGNTIHNAPFKFRTKTGETKYLVVDSNVSWNDDGTFKHTRCFIRDDTHRKINEAIKESEFKHLELLNTGKDSFIRRIFHEIKTPLHIMTDSLTEIEEAINKMTIPRREDAKLIQQNIDSILSTAEDIQYSTEFSDGHTVVVSAVPFDVEASVRDMAKYIETIERKSSQTVSFNYDFDKSLASKNILVDTTIHRVLFHLIRNAVRFSPNNSNIKIEVMRVDDIFDNSNKYTSNPIDDEECFQFKITNNINKAVNLKAINHYFHSSFSLMTATSINDKNMDENSSKHVNKSLICEKGLGLGLYVSYNLVQAMGGMLECTTDDNKSVTFQFNLNVATNRKYSSVRTVPHYTGQLLRRRSSQMLTDMCDVDVAKKHVIIEDDQADEDTTEMNTSSPIGLPVVLYSNILDVDTSSKTSKTTSDKQFPQSSPAVISPSGSSKEILLNCHMHRNLVPFENVECELLPSRPSSPPRSDRTFSEKHRKGRLLSLPKNSSESSSQCSATKTSGRILVVDDSPLCQRVLIRLLNKYGYKVDTADNGEEAVEKLSVEPCIYKACLMDLRMPIMDGITATKLCREKKHLKSFPIVVITAEVGENIRKQVEEAGANYLISKPAAAKDVLSAIQL